MLVTAVVIGAAAVAWVITLSAPPPRVTAPSLDELAPRARTSGDFAELACVHVRLASQGIQADAAATTVRTELASARVLAAEALRRDGRFAALSGGVAALDEAVRRDDGSGVGVSLRVVLRECAGIAPRGVDLDEGGEDD